MFFYYFLFEKKLIASGYYYLLSNLFQNQRIYSDYCFRIHFLTILASSVKFGKPHLAS